MYEIFEGLFIGNDIDCNIYSKNNDFAIIHACKTCHQRVLRYNKSLSQLDPNYLIYEMDNHLFLNLVDMPQELLPKYKNPIMIKSMSFIDDYISNKNILIHCNQGQSRSPSLALIYLARQNVISNVSYQSALKDFIKLYPIYNAGTGIALYLNHNWIDLIYL